MKFITKDSVIELDPKLKEEVLKQPGGEKIRNCFHCGTCTSSCPITRVNEQYNPRKIMRRVLLGDDSVFSSDFVWMCSACFTCDERCPQDVRIPDVMVALKNTAVKHGKIHSSLDKLAKTIWKHGRVYELTELELKKRERLALPEIKGSKDDVRKIFAATRLDEIMSFSE